MMSPQERMLEKLQDEKCANRTKVAISLNRKAALVVGALIDLDEPTDIQITDYINEVDDEGIALGSVRIQLSRLQKARMLSLRSNGRYRIIDHGSTQYGIMLVMSKILGWGRNRKSK